MTSASSTPRATAAHALISAERDASLALPSTNENNGCCMSELTSTTGSFIASALSAETPGLGSHRDRAGTLRKPPDKNKCSGHRAGIRRAAIALLVSGGCLIANTPSANAQATACPSGEEALTTYAPSAVPASAKSFIVYVEAGDANRISNLTVTATSGMPLSVDPYEGRAILPVPSDAGDTFEVSFDWDQDAAAAACHGRDRAIVTVAGSNETVGDPFAIQVEGQFRFRSEGQTFVWGFKPRCDYGGCATRARFPGGQKATFKLRDDGTYTTRNLRSRSTSTCTVRNTLTGRVQSFTYGATSRLELRVTRGNEVALGIKVTETETFHPGRAARESGCEVRRKKYRYSGRLIS